MSFDPKLKEPDTFDAQPFVDSKDPLDTVDLSGMGEKTDPLPGPLPVPEPFPKPEPFPEPLPEPDTFPDFDAKKIPFPDMINPSGDEDDVTTDDDPVIDENFGDDLEIPDEKVPDTEIPNDKKCLGDDECNSKKEGSTCDLDTGLCMDKL